MSNPCNRGRGPTMATHLGVTEDISNKDINLEAIKRSKHAYIEGYLVANASGFEAARAAQEAAKKFSTNLAITLSDPELVENFKSEFEILVKNGIDLVFCNLSEAKLLSREQNLEGCKKKMREVVPRFVITLGSMDPMHSMESPVIRVKAPRLRHKTQQALATLCRSFRITYARDMDLIIRQIKLRTLR